MGQACSMGAFLLTAGTKGKRFVTSHARVLMHQPDTAALLPPAASATVMVSGHTHGGQIWLPWVTRNRVLPGMSRYGWYEGQYATPAGDLFVTAGTGMIGLPARLGVMPRVDVITLAP